MSGKPVHFCTKPRDGNIPLSDCVRVCSYSASPAPVVMLSSVLLPYVQAPVQYIKCKPRKGTDTVASPRKVKFLPALTYTPVQPQYVYYNTPCIAQLPVAHAGVPYAMPINPETSALSQGYVSALSSLTSYPATEYRPVSRSELNPLSRPYTPLSRVSKQGDPSDDGSYHPKDDSSLDAWDYESGNDPDSRGSSPLGGSCPSCRKTDLNPSDVDSGVEGESDDEVLCNCYKDSSSGARRSASPSPEPDGLDEVDFSQLTLSKEDRDHIPPERRKQVDFLCRHLDSCEWRTVARELGVSDVIIQSVEYDVYESFREQMRVIFSLWASSQTEQNFRTTSHQIEKALTEIGRFDLLALFKAEEGDSV